MRNVDPDVAGAVRLAARELARRRPGRAVELRVPPVTAVQLGAATGGATHRRGTPPAVVEMDADTFLALVNGLLTWADAIATYRVAASGAHADLGDLFPLTAP
ncbi:MAG: sterol carrier family protein [Propionibacteriaceae bacterium]|nr:sterol carrier family protein [Propionibacteriaceae bacterium]